MSFPLHFSFLAFCIYFLTSNCNCQISSSSAGVSVGHYLSYSQYYDEIVSSYREELHGEWDLVEHCKMLMNIDQESAENIPNFHIPDDTSLLYPFFGVITPLAKSKGAVMLLASDRYVISWNWLAGESSNELRAYFVPSDLLVEALEGGYDINHVIGSLKTGYVTYTYYNVKRMGIICVVQLPNLDYGEYYILLESVISDEKLLNNPLDKRSLLFHSLNERKKYYIRVIYSCDTYLDNDVANKPKPLLVKPIERFWWISVLIALTAFVIGIVMGFMIGSRGRKN